MEKVFTLSFFSILDFLGISLIFLHFSIFPFTNGQMRGEKDLLLMWFKMESRVWREAKDIGLRLEPWIYGDQGKFKGYIAEIDGIWAVLVGSSRRAQPRNLLRGLEHRVSGLARLDLLRKK